MFRRGVRNDEAAALGVRGGEARAEKLSPERRKEIATAAARKRWAAYAANRRAAFATASEQ